MGSVQLDAAAETTLDRLSTSNSQHMKVMLRHVYHQSKEMTLPGKNPWWKSIVRMTDKKGNGVYLELRSFKWKFA